MYALDWQHKCYQFDPHTEYWPPFPVFPEGEYYIFLSEDLNQGTFGHPWEQTICVFGHNLLDAYSVQMPKLFQRTVRKNGQLIS